MTTSLRCPKSGPRYQVTTAGLRPGFWRVQDNEKCSTVRITRSQRRAQEIMRDLARQERWQ